MTTSRPSAGFTLVEQVVALALATMVLGTAGTLLLASGRQSRDLCAIHAGMQEFHKARAALEADLGRVSSAACVRPTSAALRVDVPEGLSPDGTVRRRSVWYSIRADTHGHFLHRDGRRLAGPFVGGRFMWSDASPAGLEVGLVVGVPGSPAERPRTMTVSQRLTPATGLVAVASYGGGVP